MPAQAHRTLKTVETYEREVGRLVAQCVAENPNDNAREQALVRTALWFLAQHGRWSPATIRIFAAALLQEMGRMLEFDRFDPDFPEAILLKRLKHDRPAPAEKATRSKNAKKVAHQKCEAAKKKPRAKPRKSLPVRELRALRGYFLSSEDEFSLWVAGYITLASHIGWRPGEMLALKRNGTVLAAPAEKHTNGRGLTDTCRIDIAAFLEKIRLIRSANLIELIDKWTADTRKWEAFYRGITRLQDNINARLASACKHLKLKRVCTYTFRHFAVACMKASGFSRAEIAVILNHATDRTASQHYARRSRGIKRAKRGLGFDVALLKLVRPRFRKFDETARPSIIARDAWKNEPSAARTTDESALLHPTL
jgi:hypothetical protein